MRWLCAAIGSVFLLALAAACGGEPLELPPSTSTEAISAAASAQDTTVVGEPATRLPRPIAATLPSVADVVEAVRPSVVNITTRVETGSFLFRRFGATANGTGAIIHSDGYLVTNFHVVYGATRIVVTMDDGSHYEASVVGVDPATDLAVLKIEGEGPFPALSFAPPESVRVGDWAIAIGNALGLPGGPSVTLGVVGAIDRSLTTQQQSLTDLIQTDAAINEGNSGGPLVDLNGEVIGINTAVVRGAQGMGFSVSSFTVVPVVQSILQYGRVRWPWMGVSASPTSRPPGPADGPRRPPRRDHRPRLARQPRPIRRHPHRRHPHQPRRPRDRLPPHPPARNARGALRRRRNPSRLPPTGPAHRAPSRAGGNAEIAPPPYRRPFALSPSKGPRTETPRKTRSP